MWRYCVTIVFLISLYACGTAQPVLSPGQAATATAVSMFATFDALPPAVKQATQTAVMQRITNDLDVTPVK